MQARVRAHPKISLLLDAEVTEVLGTDRVEGVRVTAHRTGTSQVLPVGGLFVAIGHIPSTETLRGALDLDPEGYVRVHDGTRTSVDGVFAAGDVHDRRYRQAVTAAGSGCMAAIDAQHWLAEHSAEHGGSRVPG
jgi:thioredoxin reductase (NADPH)